MMYSVVVHYVVIRRRRRQAPLLHIKDCALNKLCGVPVIVDAHF